MARSLIWAIHMIKELWWLDVKIKGNTDVYSKKKTLVVVKPLDEVSYVAEIYPEFKSNVDFPSPEEPALVVDSYGNYKVLVWTPEGDEYLEGHTSDNDGFWLAEAIQEVLNKL